MFDRVLNMPLINLLLAIQFQVINPLSANPTKWINKRQEGSTAKKKCLYQICQRSWQVKLATIYIKHL